MPVIPIHSFKELYRQAFCTLWNLWPIKPKRNSVYTLDNIRIRHHVSNGRRERNGTGDPEEVSELKSQETKLYRNARAKAAFRGKLCITKVHLLVQEAIFATIVIR